MLLTFDNDVFIIIAQFDGNKNRGSEENDLKVKKIYRIMMLTKNKKRR